RRAADRAVSSDEGNHDCRRRQSEREADSNRSGRAFARKIQAAGKDHCGPEQFSRARPEHQSPHSPQPSERQLEPDREEQQNYAELGKGLDAVGVRDGDIVQPRMITRERPKPVRADEHADQDEADDRTDSDPGEGRNDDPGGAQDDEGVAEARRAEFAFYHHAVKAGQARRVTARVTSWRQAAIPSSAMAASRLWTMASKNCSVVIHACSGPTRIARSLVICPPSTVSTQTRSRVSAKRTTSGVLSNLPRYLRPPVQAKMDAIGLVEVALPCWCMR